MLALAAEVICPGWRVSRYSRVENDPTLTAVVRSRQLHIYRDGKKVHVLAGKSAPKIIREDRLTELL